MNRLGIYQPDRNYWVMLRLSDCVLLLTPWQAAGLALRAVWAWVVRQTRRK